MKIEVNIEKRYFLSIIVAILILGGVFAVYATWDNSKTFFHDSKDVRVNISGANYSLQEAIDQKKIGSTITVSNTFTCQYSGGQNLHTCDIGPSSAWSACFITGSGPGSSADSNDGCNVAPYGSLGVNEWQTTLVKYSGNGKTFTCYVQCIKIS